MTIIYYYVQHFFKVCDLYLFDKGTYFVKQILCSVTMIKSWVSVAALVKWDTTLDYKTRLQILTSEDINFYIS